MDDHDGKNNKPAADATPTESAPARKSWPRAEREQRPVLFAVVDGLAVVAVGVGMALGVVSPDMGLPAILAVIGVGSGGLAALRGLRGRR